MEVRGIGIINVYHVRGSEHPPKKQVDLIVRNLE
jgi:serine kinase of HPr protein (carbohydrate metabolism regulator)